MKTKDKIKYVIIFLVLIALCLSFESIFEKLW